MQTLLADHPLILAEAAVAERLRRMPDVELHPQLFNTPLIYDPPAAERMAGIYREYIDIARCADLPLLLAAPTWRLDAGRVAEAGVPPTINRDAVAYMRALADASGADRLRVGGLLGPAGDCYAPAEALAADAAQRFHAPQAAALADAGVDYLLGLTMPALSEAEGMARAMIATGVPTFVSFCIDRHGVVLDGTPLSQAIARMDAALDPAPLGYWVNCSYPTFLCADEQDPAALRRLVGFDANASSRGHADLDGAGETHQDPVADWAAQQWALHREHGVQILGGCCGTTGEHLRALVALAAARQ